MNGVHSLAVRADGTLWSCGWNSSGQLGYGNFLSTNLLTQVGLDTDWQTVAAGGDHSAGVRADGTLWTWGSNFNGQLGSGTTEPGTNRPTQVEAGFTWRTVAAGSTGAAAIRSDGTLWTWGADGRGSLGGGYPYRPRQVGTDANWEALSCGYSHTVALRGDGTVWTWGKLPNQLAQPTDPIPRQISGTSWGLPY
jgi:hypothetical protein